MFRTMRRFKQQISEEKCIRILQEEKRGILSMHGEDGYDNLTENAHIDE